MKEGTIKQEGMLWDQEEGLREKAGLTGREKAGKSNVTTQRGRGSARPQLLAPGGCLGPAQSSAHSKSAGKGRAGSRAASA